MTDQKDSNEDLKQFNQNIKEFMNDNSHRIICILIYSVPSEFKPMVITYHKYFNKEVRTKFDSHVFYANNAGSNDLLIAYFMLVKDMQEKDTAKLLSDSKVFVNKFAEYNFNVTGGVAAIFYDVNSSKKVEELNQGSMKSLDGIELLA